MSMNTIKLPPVVPTVPCSMDSELDQHKDNAGIGKL